MKIYTNKIGLLIILGFTAGMLGACSGGSGSGVSGTTTSVISTSTLDAEITDLSATLEIAGMDSYPMTVNADDTVSATVEGITPGLRTMTVTYYASGVVLAKASKIIDVTSAQDMSITFSPQEIDRNFDDDFDGWVNLAEVLWGSEPLLATSSPPSESPKFVLGVTGGQTLSTSYMLQDTLGEAVSTENSSSLNYTLAGGFQAYH